MNVLDYGHWQWVIWSLLGAVGLTGLLAILSPRLFSWVVSCSSRWVNSDKFLKKLDQQIDIDRHVLQHCRLFGLMAVAVAVTVMTILLS